MDKEMVLHELQALGKDRTKKSYLSNGAREPLFGVATGAMKPLAKQLKYNQSLADALYATGNYDAMYFAGIIADPSIMTADDFERWIDDAYFYMISDYVVAVTLAESPLAQQIADKWIESNEELKMSAGWSCYCWLLGNQKDENFSSTKLAKLLDKAKDEIHEAPLRTKASMNNFISTVGISYIPLHEKALETAETVGVLELRHESKKPGYLNAHATIQNGIEKGRIGFKRKYVRC